MHIHNFFFFRFISQVEIIVEASFSCTRATSSQTFNSMPNENHREAKKGYKACCHLWIRIWPEKKQLKMINEAAKGIRFESHVAKSYLKYISHCRENRVNCKKVISTLNFFKSFLQDELHLMLLLLQQGFCNWNLLEQTLCMSAGMKQSLCKDTRF